MNSVQKLRNFRVGRFAVFDVVVAFLGTYLLVNYLNKNVSGYNVDINAAMLLVVPFGVVSHVLMGTNSELSKMLFVENNRVAQVVVGGMLLEGFRRLGAFKRFGY